MYNYIKGFLFSFLIASSLLFFLESCSSTYVQEQFPSKKEFYKKINYECSDRNVNINFAGDSSVDGNNTIVDADSVHWNAFTTDTSHRFIPLTNIEDISYSKVRLQSFDGTIKLKSDTVLRVVNSLYMKDGIRVDVTTTVKHAYSAPLGNIVSVSFDNHFKGLFQYGFLGLFGGGLAGYIAGSEGGLRYREPVPGAIAGSFICGVGGAIIGLVIGSPQQYILNYTNEPNGIVHRFGLIGGMTSSMLYGGFSDNRGFGTTELDRFAFGVFYRHPLTKIFRLRPEVLYEYKGGNYSYDGNYISSDFYVEGETAAVKLKEIEIPCLLEIGPPSISSLTVEGFIGPALNIYLNGQFEEYQLGFMDSAIKLRQIAVAPNPYVSILIGCGIKWNTHFATEFLWDQELTSSGNIQLIDGSELNIKQNDFFIRGAFTL